MSVRLHGVRGLLAPCLVSCPALSRLHSRVPSASRLSALRRPRGCGWRSNLYLTSGDPQPSIRHAASQNQNCPNQKPIVALEVRRVPEREALQIACSSGMVWAWIDDCQHHHRPCTPQRPCPRPMMRACPPAKPGLHVGLLISCFFRYATSISAGSRGMLTLLLDTHKQCSPAASLTSKTNPR